MFLESDQLGLLDFLLVLFDIGKHCLLLFGKLINFDIGITSKFKVYRFLLRLKTVPLLLELAFQVFACAGFIIVFVILALSFVGIIRGITHVTLVIYVLLYSMLSK